MRTRTCTDPPPSDGGSDCVTQGLGPTIETQSCNEQACGKNIFKKQSNKSQIYFTGLKIVSTVNEIVRYWFFKMNVFHISVQPINGGYTEWSTFSDCSTTCGDGAQMRFRTCSDPLPSDGGLDCVAQGLGSTIETKFCNLGQCGEWLFCTQCRIFWTW